MFARLGTSLLISDAIISISATMRGKRTSDDLAKSTYRFKDANPDYANSAIARTFWISESKLRRSDLFFPEATYSGLRLIAHPRGLKKLCYYAECAIMRSLLYWSEKSQIGSKICAHKTNEASASGPR